MNMEQTDRTLYEFIAEVRTTLARIEERIITLVTEGKRTDQRVQALEEAYNSMENEVRSLRDEVREMIEQKHNALKIWTLKALIITTLAGSFVWIKESRDAILSIIHALL
jgi:predicted  nucleic acid-binding Zn-ribbon protein